MKTKLKLKKQVWIICLIILFVILGIYVAKNVYDEYQYKKTIEYKLLQVGYKEEEINTLKDNLNEEKLNNLVNEQKDEFLLNILKEKYYIKKNLDLYRELHQKENEYSPTKVVSYINANRNYDYYNHDLDTDIKKDNLLIVNKYYHLSDDYAPKDLAEISNQYYYGENHKIREVAYQAFIDMWNTALKEDIYLIINSSYRTFEEQKNVYDDYKNSNGTTYADSIAARPGYSEHQTGLALDIFSKENTTTSNFKDSKAHVWLTNNAHKYGFIERYKKEFEDITGFSEEAWHWRYVGVEAATYIHDNNITLEEYYAYFVE